jgi:hypothetical protein
MTLSRQEEMEDRREVLENEKRLREQGSTFLSHTHNDIGGRFAAISSPHVVGSSPSPASQYPAASAWTTDPGSQMLEPPLSPHDNPALEPSDLASAASSSVVQGNVGDPTTPVSPVGSPISSTFRRF